VFRELVQYGEELEKKGKLPPVGFYSYGAPIHWVVHLRVDGAYLEKTELDIERPYCGRTGDTNAHLLTDEAGYIFGLLDEKKDRNDPQAIKRGAEKHQNFKALVRDFLESSTLQSLELRQAIEMMLQVLEGKALHIDPRFKEIESKQWVSFQMDFGILADQQLFEHEEAKRFWAQEMQRRTANEPPVFGECATCKERKQLVSKIPLGVKLAGVTPLHSLNANAFVSYRSGFKGAHIGICFDCADTASRAFNYLSNSEQHRRTLVFNSDKRDGLENQFALFWVSTSEAENPTFEVGDQTFDFDSLASDLALAIAEERPIEGKPRAELAQLAQLLEVKWRVKDGVINLADVGFNLGILSPNVGRIALREWITVSLEQLKTNYARYFKATRIVSSFGDAPKSFSVSNLVNAVDSRTPNLSRELLRTLMLGHAPPREILDRALRIFRNPNILQNSREGWRQQQLMSGIKLYLFFKQEEDMNELNPNHRNQAYLCGRLLAILEEAQQRASNFGLNTTLVNRFYGAASTAPGTVFGNLVRLSTTGHLPKIGKEINEHVETVLSQLAEIGNFPAILTQLEQAEFALGFYQQRASYRASRKSKQQTLQVQPVQGGAK
jgi:CRISPR-associated protein Csd1